MEYFDILTSLLSFVAGGGLVTLVTLRATSRKASEEAKGVEATNMQTILETNQRYIVEPLTKEIDALRKDIECFKCALNKIYDCDHAAQCPVNGELQKRRDEGRD